MIDTTEVALFNQWTWYSVDSMTSVIAMGLRMGALIGSSDGVSCSIVVPTAIFWDDLKGEPKKEDFLGPPPAGQPKTDELLPDLRGEVPKEARVCLIEAPIVEVMR